MPPILEARNISKRFEGTQALQGASFSLERGEVHALMGENGAGKSTLSKIFAGVYKPDEGEIFVDGVKVTIDNPLRGQDLGIGMVFQELDLFPQLTVAENMAIANPGARERTIVRNRELGAWCEGYLEQVALRVRPDNLLRDLSIGQIQRVAIARALSMKSRVVLMDEPTSSLTDDGVESLFELIARLKSQGVAFVYVSHKMAEVGRIADRITVLRDGRVVGTKAASELNTDELIAMMAGRKLDRSQRSQRSVSADVLLKVRNLSTNFLSSISFELHAHEVLGVAGLVGAGRSELGAALFGLSKKLEGDVFFDGKSFDPRSPAEAIRRGLCLLPEDRKSEALFPQMSVLENASIAVVQQMRLARSGYEAKQVDSLLRDRLAVSAKPDTAISTLSGGNQQKIIFARWLLAEPRVLFLDEPTRGIDVNTKEQMYGIIDDFAAQGKGVILVSSELPELWRCCDRILVLHEGRQAGIVIPEESTQEDVLRLATGTHMAGRAGADSEPV
jgi:ABC-type sugar transport system ATPase subunit